MLADVDHIKFAFVTRKDMPDNTKHQVLATHTIRTKNWAQQLNLNLDDMWKNLKHIVDVVEKDCIATKALEEKPEADADAEEDDQTHSEYILLKDFNKLVLRLFKKDL
jgi:translation initiation factor 3 subunit D